MNQFLCHPTGVGCLCVFVVSDTICIKNLFDKFTHSTNRLLEWTATGVRMGSLSQWESGRGGGSPRNTTTMIRRYKFQIHRTTPSSGRNEGRGTKGEAKELETGAVNGIGRNSQGMALGFHGITSSSALRNWTDGRTDGHSFSGETLLSPLTFGASPLPFHSLSTGWLVRPAKCHHLIVQRLHYKFRLGS